MIALLYILSVLIACSLGAFEALLFTNEKSNPLFREKFGFSIHTAFTIQRILIYLPIFILTTNYILSLSIMMMFSFWHNGIYYLCRKKLDGTYNGFFSQSKQTDARNSFTPIQRTILFLLSLIFIFI